MVGYVLCPQIIYVDGQICNVLVGMRLHMLYLQLQPESAWPTEFAWVVWWPSG